MSIVWMVTSSSMAATAEFFVNEFAALSTHSFHHISENDCIARLQSYLLGGENENITLVVDVQCGQLISAIYDIFCRLLVAKEVQPIKMILLSSVRTWGGKAYYQPITDVERSFRRRVPLDSACAEYERENQLLLVCKRFHLDITIIAIGIVYGRKGFDLHDIFRFIWMGEQAGLDAKYSLLCGQGSRIPIIHCDTLFAILSSAITFEKRESQIILAAENTQTPFADLISNLDRKLNGHTASNFVHAHEEAVLLSLSDASSHDVWLCDLPISAGCVTYSCLLEESFSDVWTQFTQGDGLNPVSLIIAGPPGTGKTEMAQQLAQRLGVQLVSPASSALLVVKSEQLPAINQLPENVRQVLIAAREAVVTAVRIKMSEGVKKGGKGAAAATTEEPPLDESVLSEAFCRNLPENIVRQCIAAQLRLDAVCIRKGYVLDAWDGKSVTGLQSVRDVLSALEVAIESDPVDPEAESEAKVAVVTASSVGDAGASRIMLDAVLELQCLPQYPVERLTATLGAQVKAKESQAQIKALEATIAEYNKKMKPLEASEDAGPATVSHEGVLELSTAGVRLIHRFDLAASSTEESITNAFHRVVDGLNIGWLAASRASKQSAVDVQLDDGDAAKAILDEVSVSETAEAVHDSKPTVSVSIEEQLKALDVDKKSKLNSKAEKLQDFLTANVMPHVTAGMIRILREHPADPIRFLSEYLAEHSAANNTAAEEAANIEFQQLLHGQ